MSKGEGTVRTHEDGTYKEKPVIKAANVTQKIPDIVSDALIDHHVGAKLERDKEIEHINVEVLFLFFLVDYVMRLLNFYSVWFLGVKELELVLLSWERIQ